jgi:hypothetical protein
MSFVREMAVNMEIIIPKEVVTAKPRVGPAPK